MGHLGDVVALGETVHHLVAQIQGHHQQHGQRDAAPAHLGEGVQHDHHEHHTAGSQQRRTGEEDELHQSRHQSRYQNGHQQVAAAVLFLQARPHQQ